MQQDSRHDNVEDIETCSRAGRLPRDHGPYRVKVGDVNLNFTPYVIEDPVPTGRQILAITKSKPIEEYVLFQLMTNGQMEELRLDETTDLRSKGVEKFLIFKSDRTFRFMIDDRHLEWGVAQITGRTLLALAETDPNACDIWQKVPGREDRLIEDTDLVDLSEPGVEHFHTSQVSIEIIVNGRPKTVHQRQLSFNELVGLAYPEGPINETTAYTATYKRGPNSNAEGEIIAGQSVRIKNGMVFNVTRTDRS